MEVEVWKRREVWKGVGLAVYKRGGRMDFGISLR